MTNQERAQRRRRIAEDVRGGKNLPGGLSLAAAANLYGVSTSYVRACCLEHGVQVRTDHPGLRANSYAILGRLFDPSVSMRQIANEFRVTHQNVSQIYGKAVAAGIPLPVRVPGSRSPRVSVTDQES